jgi:hypothetical protein
MSGKKAVIIYIMNLDQVVELGKPYKFSKE